MTGQIAVIAVVVGVLWVGADKMGSGVKWLWHNKSCVAHHGIKYCKQNGK